MAKEKKAPKTAPKTKKKALSRDTSRLGNSFMFPPSVIDDIHIKSELGRYRMRGFSLFKKIPSWDDLTFLPGTLTRFVIEGYREKCETKTVIGPKAKRPLVLDVLKAYATTRHVSRMFVVALRAHAGDDAFVVRGQSAGVFWDNDADDVRDAARHALEHALKKLVVELNAAHY